LCEQVSTRKTIFPQIFSFFAHLLPNREEEEEEGGTIVKSTQQLQSMQPTPPGIPLLQTNEFRIERNIVAEKELHCERGKNENFAKSALKNVLTDRSEQKAILSGPLHPMWAWASGRRRRRELDVCFRGRESCSKTTWSSRVSCSQFMVKHQFCRGAGSTKLSLMLSLWKQMLK
jgi:hypothetical protein